MIFENEKCFLIIGDSVYLGGVTFININSIEIGNDVIMAWDVTIYDHNSHSIYCEERKNNVQNYYANYINNGRNFLSSKNWSTLKDAPSSKVWIGFGVTILKGVTIGEDGVIGEKSVVTKIYLILVLWQETLLK